MALRLQTLRQVSPAHAGIDPDAARTSPAQVSFPRPRGDRPNDISALIDAIGFPPPTRG